MAASSDKLQQIIQQAEADLNSYQAKTGAARERTDDLAGVRSINENKFPGADVKYQGDDLSTNASYNKRIPPTEGGDLDDRGRQARGGHYDHHEGDGGPQSLIESSYRKNPGKNDTDVVKESKDSMIGDQYENTSDVAAKGKLASKLNVGNKPTGVGGGQFKGEDYYTPESVPDSISAEGYIPPESVTQASKEAEFGGFPK